MTTPPNQSPWKVFGDKLANLFIEAIDEGVAEAKRKAATPPPNVVPLRRDLDEDLRTGRDAASTEESSTPHRSLPRRRRRNAQPDRILA